MIYLDNAATSFPKPTTVYDAVNDCLVNYCSNPGRGAHSLSQKCEFNIFQCRTRLAKLFNIDDPLRIIFTFNSTDALNIAIKGVLKSGDHVVTTMIEHNSVLRPLKSMEKFNIETTIVPVDKSGYLDMYLFKKSLKKNTKAVIINHGSNVIGTIQDLESIGNITKSLGILLIIDAAQTSGFTDIDVKKSNIDILTFTGHKSLYGLQGTGGIYISKNVSIEPFREGGTGSISSSLIQPDFFPDKLESGTLNTPGIIGLSEGVNFILTEGINKINSHEKSLMCFLKDELSKLPYVCIYGNTDFNNSCPVLSFNLDRFDSSEVGLFLNNLGFCVRCGYHCAPLIHKIIGTEKLGTVRISPGYFNSFTDIERVISAIREIYINF